MSPLSPPAALGRQVFRVLLGLAARVPVLDGRVVNRGTGGTNRAEYCYGVWMKHLVLLRESGMKQLPETVAELGPGDSIGVGLAALLSGANRYYTLDVKEHSTLARNTRILHELVDLFRRRAPRPTQGWPSFDHLLDDDMFPGGLLTKDRMEESLADRRVAAIEEAITKGRSSDGSVVIEFKVPWDSIKDIERDTVDLIVSHSVMEHVRDPRRTYEACAAWLRDGGWMSHQIDFTCHGLADEWNGHWAYSSDLYWRLLSGRRDCWINRRPVSAHLEPLKNLGFELGCELRNLREDGIRRSELAPRWRNMSENDLRCAGCLVQAVLRVRERTPGGAIEADGPAHSRAVSDRAL